VKLIVTADGLAMLARLDEAVVVFLKQALGGLGARKLKQLRDLLGEARAGFGPFPASEASG
jgi:hypothetical protein